MIFNSRWEITGGKGDYIVTESRPGTNPKTKEPTTTKRNTYHPTLELCARYIVKTHSLDAIENENIDAVIEEIRAGNDILKQYLEALEDQTND